jgi:LacI family transcriptional regulator
MQPIRLVSVAEQTVKHLRQALYEGRWSGRLPGVVRLAIECQVSSGVVRAALRQLESEGLLTGRGLGRSRSIAAPGGAHASLRRLRIGVVLHDAPRERNPQTPQVLLEIQHNLEAAGHDVFFFKKSQVELRHDVRRMARHVSETPADAWIVVAGSRPLLEWFAEQTVPCMALYGRSGGLALAHTGPDKLPAYLAATRQLIALGHRRIVLITLRPRRIPTPGRVETGFLAELEAHGIPAGDYHLPDWEETPDGYAALLERLFQRTPPTALIIDETPRFVAAMQFLAQRRIAIPGQVSLVSPDNDEILDWCYPPVAHMTWDTAPIVRRVVRWVAAVRRNNPDRKAIQFPAEFVPGGSIGPVWKG